MREHIPLDERLRAVADMVRPGSIAADIGSDHGYLACDLVLSGISPKAYAADINEKPLARTRKTIEKYGLSDRVEALLSDGLSAFSKTPIQDIIVAGMGGELIADILIKADWIKDSSLSFVLQPMTRPESLRRSLYREGFAIFEERAVVSGKFAYAVMRAEYTGEIRELSPLFALTGKIWDNNDEHSKRYLGNILRRLTVAADGLERKNPDESAEYRQLSEQIKRRLREYV